MTIEVMLEELAEMQSRLALQSQDRDTELAFVLAPVKEKYEAVQHDYNVAIAKTQAAIDELDAAVRAAVLARGESVKGSHLHAVWSKGRESWDVKGLSGYAVAHPEVNVFRTIGAPSVSIRPVKS